MVLVATALSVLIGTQAALSQDSLPAQLRAARTALVAGHVNEAVDLADRYTGDHPRDARGFLVLGDAYAVRMPAGRFQALAAYRDARRLLPESPDPPYRMAQMGLVLGGDDGEAIAREGLERTLELDPLYRDAWEQWLTLYRNGGGRRGMIGRLAPHGANPSVAAHLAMLKVEDESYAEADSLLGAALSREPDNGSLLALRAQSALEAGDSARGVAIYRRALAHAASDSAEILWRQVIGVASPQEVRVWAAGIPPRLKGAWLETFWARRNPDLFAGVNRRIVEHFARLRYVRKHFPLQHPLVLFHRSSLYRTLNLEPSTGEREFHMRCEVYQAMAPYTPGGQVPLPGVSHARDRAYVSMGPLDHLTQEEKEALGRAAATPAQAQALKARGIGTDLFAFSPTIFVPMGFDLRNVDSTAARVGYNLATGLDDRGVMYLRFGPPEHTVLGGDNASDRRCGTPDLERWRYAGGMEARFQRPSAFSRGQRTASEMMFRPMNETQFNTMSTGLTRDATSEPAPLDFGVWTAQFRDSADHALTNLLVVSTVGEVAAALVGDLSATDRVVGAEGRVQLRGGAGEYQLLANARTSDGLGRQSLPVSLRSFAEEPALSDLLLTSAWEGEADRASVIARLSPSLTFNAGETVRCYAELYGLPRVNGIVSYSVSYSILRSGNLERDMRRDEWPDAQVLRFEKTRQAGGGSLDVETVDITPDRIPVGQYLVRLEVREPRGGRLIGRATAAFQIR